MIACAFFGHRNVPREIESLLMKTIVQLIGQGVTLFYVGNCGGFDKMVQRCLNRAAFDHGITRRVVLSALPAAQTDLKAEELADSILPEGIESVPKRFAVDHCNRWMIRQSQYVVTYVTNTIASGAAKFQALAERQGKTVIHLGE